MKTFFSVLILTFGFSAHALNIRDISGEYKLIENESQVGECPFEYTVSEKNSHGSLLYLEGSVGIMGRVIIFKFDRDKYKVTGGPWFNHHRDLNLLANDNKIVKKMYGFMKIKRAQEFHLDFSQFEESKVMLSEHKTKRNIRERCTYQLK